MESLDPANLASVNKSFNKPSEYAAVLRNLAKRNVYCITSFIFGLDNDTTGVGERTLAAMREWPPVLPVFGQITPFPATPLYDRLAKEGRLTRPKHWLEFAPFRMAHTPLKMSIRRYRTRSTMRGPTPTVRRRRGGRSIRSPMSRCRIRSATSWRASSSAEFISRRRACTSG